MSNKITPQSLGGGNIQNVKKSPKKMKTSKVAARRLKKQALN
jgi:hypothetical protein